MTPKRYFTRLEACSEAVQWASPSQEPDEGEGMLRAFGFLVGCLAVEMISSMLKAAR